MSSYGHAMPGAGARPPMPPGVQPAQAYGIQGQYPPQRQVVVAPPQPPPQMHHASAPSGTFAPGTKIQVGGHRVVIQKYLSEGGFAHVYLVKLQRPVDGTDLAVLKRVAVPDKDTLRGMRTEVETMKRLKGHRPIVTYIDSHASEMRGGGYEVFLLMEYCNGGGLIDFMNTRLQHRLTEPEIINIFTDVAEGVACMHYLRPPLLHRDLKVENVLITTTGSGPRRFKVCDFGSAAPPKPAPQSVVECRLMDEDVQKHTTLQYRSPEMVDVYRKQPIDEKSDIWALGVLLYKLCYYTTPFEEQGQLAILNASFRFPSYPVFSDRLKKLIASMLRESQQARPTIYQALREACLMQGREVPIQDIYTSRSHSEPRKQEKVPLTDGNVQSTPVVGAVFSQPQPQKQAIPEIVPMRRGRLPAPAQAAPQPNKPSSSPRRVTNGDPFAALDAKGTIRDVDELSSRFPTLDHFAILHDQGSKFEFEDPVSPPGKPQKDLSQKVTEILAEDAFAKPSLSVVSGHPSAEISRPKSVPNPTDATRASDGPSKTHSVPIKVPAGDISRASAIISSTPELKAISRSVETSQPATSRASRISPSVLASTSPPQMGDLLGRDYPPIYRFPAADQHRSSSLPRQQDNASPQLRPEGYATATSRPGSIPRVPSFQSQTEMQGHTRQPSSSRPSLEGGRPSIDLLEPIPRTSLSSIRPRPASTHLDSSMDYLRQRETSSSSRPLISPGHPSPKYAAAAADLESESAIESNVEFLRSMEDSDPKKKDKPHKHHHQHHHGKRSSLNALQSGTKSILAGKFGDAFKKFEGNHSSSGSAGARARTPSPLKELEQRERRDLTPIAGSEATDGRSDDGAGLLDDDADSDDMPPEIRRERERRRLSMEEKRVAAAQAEYRRRLADRDAIGSGGGIAGGGPGSGPPSSGGSMQLPKSIGGVTRVASIQNKVQSLLGESQRSTTNVSRTAEGYGRFADAATTASRVAEIRDKALPDIPRKPVGGPSSSAGGPPNIATASSIAGKARMSMMPPSSSAIGGGLDLSVATTLPPPVIRPAAGIAVDSSMSALRPVPPPKPVAPPKPTRLGSLSTGSTGPGGSGAAAAASPPKPISSASTSAAALAAAAAGASVAAQAGGSAGRQQQRHEVLVAEGLPGRPVLDMSAAEKEDYIRDFTKRYPSLGSIEMVETDVVSRSGDGGR